MASSGFNLSEYILHHVTNSYEWQLPFLPAVTLPKFLSLHALMLLICSAFLILLFAVLFKKDQKVPTGLTNLLELFVIFIRDEIAVSYLGKKDGRKMTPLFCTFFFFILTLNLMGLIPLFSTATTNINVTGALAVITFCFMVFGAIYKNGLSGFFKALIPSGVPWPILIILFPIEFLGLFIKTFALMVRLFANMLAGHIAIIALLGLIVLLGLVALPAVALAVFISLIEVIICFLQAYVFTLLSALFIGQMYHPDH